MGGSWGYEKRARNRGSAEIYESVGWLNDDEGTIRLVRRRFSSAHLVEVDVRLNPNKLSEHLLRLLRHTLTLWDLGGADPYVMRVDPAWDLQADRYQFRLDAGRRKPDHLGITSRGPETERFGYRAGSKLRGQIYDKSAERRAKGVDDAPADWMRFELQCSDVVVPGVPAGEGVRLSELGRMECPIPPDVCVLELVRDPDKFADERYLALGCVATMYGPKVMRRVAERLLGRSGVRDAAFSIWHDHTPILRETFPVLWPTIAAGLSGLLRASE